MNGIELRSRQAIEKLKVEECNAIATTQEDNNE
jgi:hypothetical protein